jgi:hypothetical protein
MSSRSARSPLSIFFVLFYYFCACVFLFGGVFSGGFGLSAIAFGQGHDNLSAKKTSVSSSPTAGQPRGSGNNNNNNNHRNGARPYLRDQPHWNWNQRGRSVPPGESAAALRLRAYRQKMAWRAQRAATTQLQQSLDGPPAPSSSASSSTMWTPLGPAPLASDATGSGEQNYNWVSGRATSVVIDPADTTGNTVLLGGAYGGLWKSTNAGSLSPDPSPGPASVVWLPLLDDQPTLAVGAIALQPGNSSVILVGTGETNNSADSYYGLGILLSTDGGSTWAKPITGIGQTPDNSFLGIGFSKIAFSTANPNLVVAATAGDNGLCLGEESATAGNTGPCLGPQEDGNSPARGLYYSTNAGATWNRATVMDGEVATIAASATSVIYNPSQGTNGTYYAFIRRHGLYSSTDGQNFTRLITQPTTSLTTTNCPASSNAITCPIYRGEITVVPGRNEMYVWIVDVQGDFTYGNPTPYDEGIWQSINGGANWTLIPDNGITNCGDDAFGPNSGCGVEQGWYNLALAAIPDSTTTDVYAGAVNLYKCTLQPGSATCTQTNNDWINLTHVYGCNPLGAPAQVHPSQHGIAFMVVGDTSPGYFAHDGGISRTLDGYAGLDSGSCSGTNQFDSLSQTLGSMTEFVSISLHPSNANVLLGGAENNNGSPKTSTATTSTTWQNALGGDGGFTAINPTNPDEWFAANPYVAIFECDSATGTGTECNDSTFSQVVGSNDLGGDQGAYITPFILDPNNPSEMLVGTCRVWRISTSGTSPLELSNDFDTLGTGVCTGDEINLVTALAAGGPPNETTGDSETVYAVTNGYGPLNGSPGGEVWATADAGNTLMANITQNVNPNGYAISSVVMESSSPADNTAFIGIMGFNTSHVFKATYASGSWNWTDWTGTGLPDAPVNALLVDSSVTPFQIYAGTDVGVFVSSTTTPSWTEVGPAPATNAPGFLPNAPVTALQLATYAGIKTLVASTYGRGVWNAALTPSFAIAVAATPNVTVVNQNVTWSGTLQALDGYSGSVTLTCTAGAPATCIPTGPVTPTAAGTSFTVTLGNATTGVFNFTIQGTDGTLTRSTPIETLTVGSGVTWTDTGSATAMVMAGQSASYTFSAVPVGAATFSSAVNFACENLPALTSCEFSPASIAAGMGTTAVTLTISTAGPNAAAQARPRLWTVSRAAGVPRLLPPIPHPVALKTDALGATVRAELRQNMQAHVSGRPYMAAVRPRVSPFFALGWVMLAAGIACGGRGRKRHGKPRLYKVSAGICAAIGLLLLIACGAVSGGGSGSSGNFAIAMTLTPGSTAVNQNIQWNGMLTSSSGYSGTVALSCTSDAPAMCAFAPQVVTPTTAGTPFALTLSSATTGTFTFTISGTDGTLTNASPTETLTVTASGPPPNFAIAFVPQPPTPNTAAVNQDVTWNGTLTALNGYLSGVTMSCIAVAPQVVPGTCVIIPPTQVASAAGAPFTVTLGSATAGTFNFTISGTDGTLTNATPTETLTVGTVVTVSPGVPSSVYPNSPGWPSQTAQFTATVTNVSNTGVTWSVTTPNGGTIDANGVYTAPLVATGLPTSVTVTATSQADTTISASAQETLNAATIPGTYSNIMVTATENAAAHSDPVTLIVQ